ncbi:hypothetical protein CC80DRAFT_493341 [Byssothecium circinans]|uniref:Uncharacterized protein n=1 Tax=Byssothecium circinans TaxID=147558 RepID=A0A6A5TQI2_9PLEO|nr:hypothetical protein CC80DRAFT_493341 [Byssothecium circinans]
MSIICAAVTVSISTSASITAVQTNASTSTAIHRLLLTRRAPPAVASFCTACPQRPQVLRSDASSVLIGFFTVPAREQEAYLANIILPCGAIPDAMEQTTSLWTFPQQTITASPLVAIPSASPTPSLLKAPLIIHLPLFGPLIHLPRPESSHNSTYNSSYLAGLILHLPASYTSGQCA